MAFRIVIEELVDSTAPEALGSSIERYRQTVDVIDLKKIIAAVNNKPRGPRAKKGGKE